jgi:hypothetical protein
MVTNLRAKIAVRRSILVGLGALLVVSAAGWGYLRYQNQLSVSRAERLSASIQKLKVGSSDYHAAQAIAAEFGTVPPRNPDAMLDCGDGYSEHCMYYISVNKGWFPLLVKHPMLAHFGLRNWSGWADIEILRGVVVEYSLSIEYMSKKGAWRGFGAEELGEVPTDRAVQAVISTTYSIERNDLMGYRSGFELDSSVTPAAKSDERKRAWHFEFRCLAERDGCGEICEVMPDAWQDFFRVRGHFDVEKYGEAYRFCTTR